MVSTLVKSPSNFPIRDLANGDAKEIFPEVASASSSPTILYFIDFSISELKTVTVVPKITLSEGSILEISMIWAFESLISISFILASVRLCCSFAA